MVEVEREGNRFLSLFAVSPLHSPHVSNSGTSTDFSWNTERLLAKWEYCYYDLSGHVREFECEKRYLTVISSLVNLFLADELFFVASSTLQVIKCQDAFFVYFSSYAGQTTRTPN